MQETQLEFEFIQSINQINKKPSIEDMTVWVNNFILNGFVGDHWAYAFNALGGEPKITSFI